MKRKSPLKGNEKRDDWSVKRMAAVIPDPGLLGKKNSRMVRQALETLFFFKRLEPKRGRQDEHGSLPQGGPSGSLKGTVKESVRGRFQRRGQKRGREISIGWRESAVGTKRFGDKIRISSRPSSYDGGGGLSCL